MQDGGAASPQRYGPALPLKAQVFIGSEYGRHRSVVMCEVTAQNLRYLLRKNESNKIDVTETGGGISVGTVHRDVDHAHKDEEAYGKDLRRQANYENKQKHRRNHENGN